MNDINFWNRNDSDQIINELNSLKVSVTQNDRDYGNRFKQTSEVITDNTKKVSELEQTANGISTRVEEVNKSLDEKITTANSRIDQNADNITAEVKARTEAVSGLSTELTSKITQNTTDISAKVSKTQGDSSSAFGWTLTDDAWKIFNESKDILVANKDGLSVTGNITANRLIIKSGKSIEEALLSTQSAAETNAANAVDTKFGIQDYTDKDGNGKILADNLAVKSAQIDDLVTDQLAVLTKDLDGNKQPILLVNATVDDNGDIERTEGNVQISGFNVSPTSLSATDDNTNNVTISTHGIALGKADNSTNLATYPFMVHPDGEIIATKGQFSGSIVASGAHLTAVEELTMNENTSAVFAEISAKDSISATGDRGRFNSSNGYFFGSAGSDCGFKLQDTATTNEETVTLTIETRQQYLGALNVSHSYSYQYSIYIEASVPLVAARTIEYSEAVWGTGSNTVTIEAGSVTIPAGGRHATVTKYVPSANRYNNLKYDIVTRPFAVVNNTEQNPTNINIDPLITNGITFKQRVVSKGNDIELNCNTFIMNGSISMTGNVTSSGAFYVKNSSNETLVTLDSNGLTTEKAVKFKVGSNHYEPAIRLGTDGSPNCFWSKAFEIGGDGGSGWKAVTLPGELKDSSGSAGNNSKIIAILATGKFPKDVDKKDPSSGDAQGATFYTWWDGTNAYVYNPISKAPKNFVINIVVLGKI